MMAGLFFRVIDRAPDGASLMAPLRMVRHSMGIGRDTGGPWRLRFTRSPLPPAPDAG